MPGEQDPADPEPTESALLGDRPQGDDLALDVAESRIAAKLFGREQAVSVGRYRLLEQVGRGGMGIVWGAWDPELQRKVAIKLVAPQHQSTRDRIVDEARALAKLSHPNVVPVYDVGVLDERVYLVMEWVVGEDLRKHLREPRPIRVIVDLYMQAARGLAAVHAAGLVHRDFKPENAMRGDDGRVRVLDFGLARGEAADGTREIVGTPGYMPPEQRAGLPPTPAVDQFALCVALREALEARGELPRWLADIIERGTAEAPAARYASMDEIARALGRDPARVWRRRILAVTAVAATATAFALGRAGSPEDACSSARKHVVAASAKTAIATHLGALGGFAAAQAGALLEQLERHDEAWGAARNAACTAHARGELTTAFYERRLTCLARAEASLATTVEILRHATPTTFPDARIAVNGIVDPALCERVDQSLVPPPDPRVLDQARVAAAATERARMLTTAARPDAGSAATAARVAAEASGYPAAIARAFLVEGRAQMLVDDPRSRQTLERAMRVGFAAQDAAIAVEAFARMAYVVARRDGKAVDGTTVIDAVAAQLRPDAFARLLLLNNLAVVQLATNDDPSTAVPLLELAMRDWRLGQSEDDYELVSIPQNLALAIAEPARSIELLGKARSEVAQRLGNDHPKVLEIEQAQAMFLELGAARTLIESACERLGRLFPQLIVERANCEYEAAWIADEAGDSSAAAAHFTSASIDANAHPLRVKIAVTMAALVVEDVARAEAANALERAANDASTRAAAPWDRAVAADGFVAAARGWETANDPVAARRCWDRARTLLEVVARPFIRRRLARAKRALQP